MNIQTDLSATEKPDTESAEEKRQVGNKLANAALIIALAVLLWVIRWW